MIENVNNPQISNVEKLPFSIRYLTHYFHANKTDKGVLVVLDERFVSASYANLFKSTLPNGVPIEIYKNDDLGIKIQDFINEKADLDI